jgi:hypothetical protein
MNATTIVIAITVDGDHGEHQHLPDRIAQLLDRHWNTHPALPRRVAQDIRVRRFREGAIGDMLNKACLGEVTS